MEGTGPAPLLLRLLLAGLLTGCLGCASTSEGYETPVVHLRQGQARGRCVAQPRAQLLNYYAFEGMRYARPPVGERRFKDPEEPESWNGVKNATGAGAICIQKNLLTQEVTGEEDCLFINVYTAHAPSSWAATKYPVVVWIHPGAFYMGSGNMDLIRPDDLLRRGLIVVSFNYRLGVMGFLNTQDPGASGNAGIKDVVKALEWVKDNIAAFGGDPKKVAVVGHGAGGAIVHYLMLAPHLTIGLFHGAVSMSGSALAPWALVDTPRDHAAALRAQLCPGGDPDAIVACLQGVEAADLVRSQDIAAPTELALRFWKSSFLPSVEEPGSGPNRLLTADPTHLMREGRFLHVPYITGFTSAEGIVMMTFAGLFADPSRWGDVGRRFSDIFGPQMPPGLHNATAAQRTRQFYFGDRELSDDQDTRRGLVQLCTDLFVAVSTVSSARLMTQKGAPVYMYEFTRETSAPLLNASQAGAAAHTEELAFLFPFAQPGQPPSAGAHNAAAARRKWTRMIADFAKELNPTPTYRLIGRPKWPVYTSKKEKYLDFGTNITVRDHILGDRIKFWRQLAKCKIADLCESNPVVRVQQGLLRGQRQESVVNGTYFSWQGIPYAETPIGSLRFKDAQPPKPWLGIRDAQQVGSNCPQDSGEEIVGAEDCLFVNVFAPHRPSWLLDALPVMFWVHGGGFVGGSGDPSGLGPDYLLLEDIIFVTVNYRLGVLGFLYLEAASPGNVGLKDQVAAERWAQANIAAFGGDPSRVTLAGESAGSASVHLQLLSPLTEGLFHQAIGQSGSALSPWAIQTQPVQTALNLAAALNCSSGEYEEVVECLRDVPVDQLVTAAVTNAATQPDRDRMVTFVFVPTPDYPVEGVETFLPAPAVDLVSNNAHHAVPYLTGFNAEESILHMAYRDFRDPIIGAEVDTTWNTTILPDLRIPPNSSIVNEALQAMRQFFMHGNLLSNTTFLPFMNMLTDIGFAEGIYKAVSHMAEAAKAPVYLYNFGVDDDLNFLKIFLGITDVPGAAHADDMGYLYHITGLGNVPDNSTAALARKRMVKMWTNFVKSGDPTPINDTLGVRWLPYTPEVRNYLDITAHLEAKTDLNEERVNFWRQFYTTYGNETY